MNHFSQNLAEVFEGVSFGLNVQVIGMSNLRIGSGSCVGDNAWLNICHRDEHVRMRIGRRVLVGRGSMISSGGYVELGDYCLLAPRVFVADADHVYGNITRPYMDQGATSGRLVVEENCWLGINAVITGSITVGRGSVVGANAVVTRDVPPFSVAAGMPALILKMFDFRESLWVMVRDEEHRRELMAARENYPPPSRKAYTIMLRKNANNQAVNPIVGGGGVCI